jgi:hypothetical protein
MPPTKLGTVVKPLILVLAMAIAGSHLAAAQEGDAIDETTRSIDKAMGYAIAADTLCGTSYLNTVIANARLVGLTMDDVMRRDKPRIDKLANRLLAENNSKELKDKFCEKIKRDVASSPDD